MSTVLQRAFCTALAVCTLFFISLPTVECQRRCKKVFKPAASLNVSVEFAPLEFDRSRYDFTKFLVSFPEEIGDIFECKGAQRRITLRYKRSDSKAWWKMQLGNGDDMKNVTVEQNIEPCKTYKFQLRARVVGKSPYQVLNLESKSSGPRALPSLKVEGSKEGIYVEWPNDHICTTAFTLETIGAVIETDRSEHRTQNMTISTGACEETFVSVSADYDGLRGRPMQEVFTTLPDTVDVDVQTSDESISWNGHLLESCEMVVSANYIFEIRNKQDDQFFPIHNQEVHFYEYAEEELKLSDFEYEIKTIGMLAPCQQYELKFIIAEANAEGITKNFTVLDSVSMSTTLDAKLSFQSELLEACQEDYAVPRGSKSLTSEETLDDGYKRIEDILKLDPETEVSTTDMTRTSDAEIIIQPYDSNETNNALMDDPFVYIYDDDDVSTALKPESSITETSAMSFGLIGIILAVVAVLALAILAMFFVLATRKATKGKERPVTPEWDAGKAREPMALLGERENEEVNEITSIVSFSPKVPPPDETHM